MSNEKASFKLTFISNFFNHHQQYLCDEFHKLLGDGFTFIETTPFTQERKDCGWQQNEYPEYVLCSYESNEVNKKCRRLADESDAVIIGSAPDEWIFNRLKNKKITFRYNERWYKKELKWYKRPRAYVGGWLHHRRFKSLYMLCASAYTAGDALSIGCYKNKLFKWGYFPQFIEYNEHELLSNMQNDIPNVLWCGRMLDWKHPDDAVNACAKLINNGTELRLTIIGNGEQLDKVKTICENENINKYIDFAGTLSPNQVRGYMEKADIFLFTSDRNEGWGVVLNEAMNSGCAVISSKEAGSAPFLINDGINGILYESGSTEMLADKLKQLIENPERRRELGLNAYSTIKDEWNPKSAANSFIRLCKAIEKNDNNLISKSGPCSIAGKIR